MKNNIIRFFKSFKYASRGIAYSVRTQRNVRFHITAVVFVLILSLFYDLSRTDYAVLFLTFSSVIVCELVNTAIETAVDLCSPDYHKLAKIAKDTASGAVLVSAVFSVFVAVEMFWDTKVFAEIGRYFIGSPPALIGIIMLAVLSFVFVFYK